MSDFIKDCIEGYALMTEIDDYIDAWHQSDSDLALHDFLGMTRKEYALFIEDNNYLASIITAHKSGQNIVSVIHRLFVPLAARSSDSTKTVQLRKWLKNEKLWD